MEKVTYVWKIKLSSTLIYAGSVSFLTSSDDRIQKYFVDASGFPCINLYSLQKKMITLLWLRVYNQDFGL